MTNIFTPFVVVIVLACSVSYGAHAAPTQTVAVTLHDTTSDPSMTSMMLKIDPITVKAGKVTFEAVNQSRDLVHEVLVVSALAEGNEMPYDKAKDIVIEKRVHPLGEISDLRPGTRGKLTLNLKPGVYLLLCNEPGHYKSGMWNKLVVER